MIQPIDFILLSLAAWYAAYAISKSILTTPLRRRFSFALLKCPLCLMPWLFAGLWLLWLTPAQPFVWVLAGAGAALNLSGWTGAHHLWGNGE